ncbi:hypothetical protein GGS21DRAFT_488763 [Xylaria nigripes]|nr:hypothetical protein GGS21DRAFT_488763 [Xylaria nigripes]
MRLNNTPASLLVAAASLCSLSSALPVVWERTPAEAAVAARPTYSIVPIDGSGGQGSDADHTQTVTITPKPTTVIESLPPLTETVTVSAEPSTRTISIIDIEPTTEFVTTTFTPMPATTTSVITWISISLSSAHSTTATATPAPSTSSPSSITSSPSFSTGSSLSYPTSISMIATNSTVAPFPTAYSGNYSYATYSTRNGTIARQYPKRI